MPTHFDLIITADTPNLTAEFRLLDAHGSQLAYHHTDFNTISVSHRQGLFDLRNYLRLYVAEGQEPAAVAEIGACIAEDVLGQDIFAKLWASESQRTLRIQLPGAAEADNHLVAALARVPWEIAKPKADAKTLGERNLDADTLGERNLLVRVVHDMLAPTSQPVELAPDEPLRVLFVFAEARGSRPLGARQERRELLRLFERNIYPQRRVVAHFLSHGVTRERLIDQIQQHSGYHIVHWSGHGHLNLLELAKPGGAKDHLSGGELLDLFTDAGGFLPRLVFLNACYSGDILRVKDWKDFLAVAQGQEPGTKEAETKDLDLQVQPGFTGTAHALLHGGVPSVVAMRYAVGDDYARELAVEFYRALLAHPQPKNAAAALTLARQALLDGKKHDLARFAVCDHATPVLYGVEQPGLTLVQGRSPELNPHNPRLHPIAELTTASHEHFVGRTWELAGLGADFIGSSTGAEVKPVAVITGLGGMGKTALVAEALALWETRFEWVLLYQAKPNALGFDATLRDIDLKLRGELGRYHDHVKARPADAVYRDASAEFTGPARLERLTRNLIRALQDEAILLVLDNFETNLKPQAEPSSVVGQPVWACQDPAWDGCLKALASELAGTRSRVLVTSRRPLAALANGAGYPVPLGPLPPPEAALYLRAHPALSRMVFGADAGEKALALRLLNASRFHPLLMDRLARLAADAKLRPQLLQALDTLEQTKDFAQLPALFATTPSDAKELDYLNDALAVSLDQLIRDASPDARRVLWLIAVANEPVALGLLNSVWSGKSYEQQQLRQIKQMLDNLLLQPPELQEKLKAMPPELRALLDALPPETPPGPKLQPMLHHLVSVGLVTEEREGPDDINPNLTCHELVRERIRAWMAQQPQDRGEWTENAIRLAYAERLEAEYDVLQHQNMTAALQAGSRALVYCVQAEAWDRLGGFASGVVTSTSDPRLLAGLIPHLQIAAESAPEGEPRWSCLCYLADALRLGGRPDASLPFYEQAATLARAATEAGGESARQAWSNLAWITGNWANALYNVGHLDAARQRQLESAEASKQAGRPQINVIGSELEALRIDIRQGQVETALPQIEARLARVAAWWQRQRAGQPVPEAPDAELLARAYISALDIARDADYARQDWVSALCRGPASGAETAVNPPASLAMPTSPNPQRPLADLLAELEAAVCARDRVRAIQLEQAILQRLATEAAVRARIEHQVRALLAELDRPQTEICLAALDVLDLKQRSILLPAATGVVYPVWFGTNRKPSPAGFTGERHDRTTLGRALVYVPEAHRFGETGTGFWRRLLRFDLRDDRLHLREVERREREAFFAEINEAMRTARDTGETPHALFFLHGFNVTFEDAAIRAAQLGVDLKVPGATAFFSWPSRGSVAAYPADEATIEASEPAITDFLVDFAANCGAEKVHVIAHSMGNRGLLRALQRIAANAQTRGKVKFGQIFLAAPDVDRDLFLDLARLYPEHAERATLYASDGDKAVHLSAKLHDAPRAGYFAPYTVAPGVDTVAVPDFDIDLLGHGYFAQAEALLHDIYDLMRHGQAPVKRQRIMPAVDQGTSFWKLRR